MATGEFLKPHHDGALRQVSIRLLWPILTSIHSTLIHAAAVN